MSVITDVHNELSFIAYGFLQADDLCFLSLSCTAAQGKVNEWSKSIYEERKEKAISYKHFNGRDREILSKELTDRFTELFQKKRGAWVLKKCDSFSNSEKMTQYKAYADIVFTTPRAGPDLEANLSNMWVRGGLREVFFQIIQGRFLHFLPVPAEEVELGSHIELGRRIKQRSEERPFEAFQSFRA